ncbi:hypothetical protein A1b_00057 [Klebsiella phage VLCpiA1b]|nr:hypothetical protein A1b_00057 [Klebsiella phage VLCpiA1b]
MHLVTGELFDASNYALNHYIIALVEVAAALPELAVDSAPRWGKEFVESSAVIQVHALQRATSLHHIAAFWVQRATYSHL